MSKLALSLCAATLAVGFAATPAAAIPFTLYSTGVDDLGLALPDYAADPHYTLSVSPGFPVAPAVAVGAPDLPPLWAPNSATSRWINPNGVGGVPADWHPGGIYEYTTTFDLTGLDPSTVVITLEWAADDASVGGSDFIRINGVPLPSGGVGSGVGPDPGSFTGFHLKLIEASTTPFFVPGINTLTFVTGNAGPAVPPLTGPTGVHVKILSTDAAIIPEPGTALLLGAGLVGIALSRRGNR